MDGRRLAQLAQLAFGLPGYLRRPMTVDQAAQNIAWRMAHREDRFLTMARRLIYAHPGSPYRKLLQRAGWEYVRLEESVTRLGVEQTLEVLRDVGVYVTLEEFKSTVPIRRPGLTIQTTPVDFDAPRPTRSGVEGTTSGSRSKPVRVGYDWGFLAEEAANELLLYEVHGVSRAPSVLWYPAPPAISGMHHALLHAKFRRPPQRWFSHVTPHAVGHAAENHLAVEYLLWCCRVLGLRMPRPEFADVEHAVVVAAWMEQAKRRAGTCVLKTYASSAVRVVQAAKSAGIDLSGTVMFAGGEPLTDRRRQFIESAGVKVFPRYVATESGLIAASCPHRASTDEMHLHMDRLAVIQRTRETRVGGHCVETFLFSSLSPRTGKVLLNTELGDFGTVSVAPCKCVFGALGMNVRVSNVRSHDKLTGEGMTLLGSELDAVVGELIAQAGGCPDDYQFWETHNGDGLSRLMIAISPTLQGLNADDFLRAIWQSLRERTVGAHLASEIWRHAGTLEVVRAKPALSRGHKRLPIVTHPPQVLTPAMIGGAS